MIDVNPLIDCSPLDALALVRGLGSKLGLALAMPADRLAFLLRCAAYGESALLKMGCVMGRQLRKWTRPCPASRGSPPLLLSRGPGCLGPYSGIFQKDQNKESAPGAPWVKGPDLLGQCRLIEYIRAGSPVIQESI